MADVITNKGNYSGASKFNWIWKDPEWKDPSKKSASATGLGLTYAPASSIDSSAKEAVDRSRVDNSFNNIKYNTFAKDDLFSTLPRYNVGEGKNWGAYVGGAIGTGITAFEFGKGTGWGFKIGLGANNIGYHFSGEIDTEDQVDNHTMGIGLNAPFQFMMPKYNSFWGSKIYGQFRGDINYTYINSMEGNHSVNLDINTIGLYLEDLPVPGTRRDRFDFSPIELMMKLNLASTDNDVYREIYGAHDLDNGKDRMGRTVSALWLKSGLDYSFDDLSNLVPVNIGLYAKGAPPMNGNFDKWRYFAGLTLTSQSLCLNLEYGKNAEEPTMNIYAGIKLFDEDNMKVTLNGGIMDLFNKETRSYLLGSSYNGKVNILGNEFVFNISANFHWDNVQAGKSPRSPKTWDDSAVWPGLDYRVKRGADQVSHAFRFESPAMTTNKGDIITLKIGSANGNHKDGVAFKYPDGNWIDRDAKVKIESIQVFDNTKPPRERELVGVGSSLIGAKLVDVVNGTVPSVNIPINGNGVAQYTIIVNCSTIVADMAPDPAVPECKVKVIITREAGDG